MVDCNVFQRSSQGVHGAKPPRDTVPVTDEPSPRPSDHSQQVSLDLLHFVPTVRHMCLYSATHGDTQLFYDKETMKINAVHLSCLKRLKVQEHNQND